MPIEINIDQREIARALERLKGIPYAAQRAVDTAIWEVLREARGMLAARLESDIPTDNPKHITKAIKASMTGRGAGYLRVRDRYVMPLIDYAVRPKANTAQPGVGVKSRPSFTYSLKAGERRSQMQLRIDDSLSATPFIATMKSGHMGVFVRDKSVEGEAGIKQLMGPWVQYYAAAPEVEADVIDYVQERFPAVLDAHVRSVMMEEGWRPGK